MASTSQMRRSKTGRQHLQWILFTPYFPPKNFHHIRLQWNSSDNSPLGHLFLTEPHQTQPLYLSYQSTKLNHDQWDLLDSIWGKR